MSQTVGLYIHIPFCEKKCGYCDFYSLPVRDEAVWKEYVKALAVHLAETAPSLSGYTVDTVYFGGGTPSLLGHKYLSALMDAVRKRFPLSSNAEVTLEANPNSIDLKMLKKLRRAGFNRLSLGVQSLDDGELAVLGRVHTAAQAERAFGDARDAGFSNISADLLFGVPGQTVDGFLETLRGVLAWNPEHISCYGLKLEDGTPLFAARGDYHFPDDDAQADQYLAVVRTLAERGYEQYEISNFCKPSRASRHNRKYWALEPYLGLGPSAHSDFGGRRWSYVKSLRDYIDGVLHDGDILAEMEKVPPLERTAEYLMLGLRTAGGVSGSEYTRRFRVSFEAIERVLERQAARGLSRREGDRWRLTPEGFLLSNRLIGEVLDAREERGAGAFGYRR